MAPPKTPDHDLQVDEMLPPQEASRSYVLTPAMVREIQRFSRFESIPFQEALKSCLLVGVDYWNYGRVPGEGRDIE